MVTKARKKDDKRNKY